VSRHAAINLVLLVICLALLTFLAATDPDDLTPPAVTLTDIDPETISNIIIRHAGRADLRFTRLAEGWRMESPLAAPANPVRIGAILGLLSARSFNQLVVAGLDPDKFGIRDPEVVLLLGAHEFRFGGLAALDNRRYLLYQERVHLINDGLLQQLQQGPEFFIRSQNE
jgi:hypothetical protein